jgi:Zn-dependent peptidase ImmA (M78 family)/transcriptional regulator with XRE-family HTH domain
MASENANPEMIILARESRGLTQRALAKAIAVAQGTISKIENGQAIASDEMVQKISSVLQYPVEFFSERPEFRNLPIVFYRKRIRVSATLLKQLRARLNIVRQHTVKLVRSADLPETQIPLVDLKEYRSDPGRVAQELRIRWHLPRGPVDNLTKVLEDAGILIVRTDFGTDRVDAISIYEPPEEIPPLILINKSIPGDRYRFTLAHETGHLVLHHHLPLPNENIEDEANSFAGEFLLPAKDIRGFLQRCTLQKLASLKPYWKVSMQALLMRASQLSLINDRQKYSLWKQISAAGYKISEPFALEPEKPSLFGELIDFHLNDLGYSEASMTGLLHLELHEFRSNYRNVGTGLRLIK